MFIKIKKEKSRILIFTVSNMHWLVSFVGKFERCQSHSMILILNSSNGIPTFDFWHPSQHVCDLRMENQEREDSRACITINEERERGWQKPKPPPRAA